MVDQLIGMGGWLGGRGEGGEGGMGGEGIVVLGVGSWWSWLVGAGTGRFGRMGEGRVCCRDQQLEWCEWVMSKKKLTL